MEDFDYSDEFLGHMAELFKAFSHVTRLKILRALHQKMKSSDDGLSVSEIQSKIGTSQANISKHLSKMENQGLVKVESQGTSRHFMIASEDVIMICDYVCDYMESRLEDLASIQNPRNTREEGEEEV